MRKVSDNNSAAFSSKQTPYLTAYDEARDDYVDNGEAESAIAAALAAAGFTLTKWLHPT